MELTDTGSPRTILSTNSRNPLDKRRSVTDTIFIFIFLCIFISWIGLVKYGFTNSGSVESSGGTQKLLLIKEILKNDLFNFSNAAMGISIGAIIFSLLIFLSMLKYVSKFFIYFAATIFVIIIIFLMVVLGVFIYITCYTIYTGSENFLNYIYQVLYINFTTASIIYFIVLLICIKKAKVSTIAEFFKKISQAFFPCIHLIIFPILIYLFIIGIWSLTKFSLSAYDTNVWLLIIIALETQYLLSFILFLGRMVIAPTVATWYWAQNRKDVPKTLMFHHVIEIFRNHFGSAAYAALPILPFCISLFESWKRKFNYNQFYTNRLINIILYIYLAWNNGEISSIVTAIYGQSFRESTRKTCNLLTRNRPLSLIFLNMLNFVISLQIGFILLFTHISLGLSPSKDSQMQDEKFTLSITEMLSLPVFIFFDLIAKVIFICTQQDDEDNDTSQETTTLVTNDSQERSWV